MMDGPASYRTCRRLAELIRNLFSVARLERRRIQLVALRSLTQLVFYSVNHASKMRGKRSKQYRKLMEQFSMTFGFREPYQVLGKLSRLAPDRMKLTKFSRCRDGARLFPLQDGP